MRKLLALLLLAGTLLPAPEITISDKELLQASLDHHPFNQRARLTPEELKELPKQDRPDLAWEQNFLATMDPKLGRPAPERLIPIYQQIQAQHNSLMALPGSANTPWVERGPNNVGGRTRAIAFDPNDPTHKKVWAGGVSGGLWYNNDINNANSSWQAVNDFWDNVAISAIAFDPLNSQVIYVGTGEGWGAGSGRGAGIWKSTNGGTSWSHLSATSDFYYVHDLVVRDEGGNSGVLYVALRSQYYRGQWHGSARQGLQRSTNGGVSFSQVLPLVPGKTYNYAAGDLEIAADNTLWVGTRDASYGDGGGTILKSTNGTSFTVSYSDLNADRVELACAPSDSNYLYAIIESGNQVEAIIRSTNGGTSWTTRTEPADADNGIPNSDFSRGQAWYDLTAAVDPNDRNTLIVGAIDLFRSTNGGNSWDQISKWSNNNNLWYLNCSWVHADQHAIVFAPGSSNKLLFGNDGGVFYTTNVNLAAVSSQIVARNKNYNVTQFYAGAIHPTAGSNYFLAGAQDNGSQQFQQAGMNSSTTVTGGDGAFCFIDQNQPSYQITSYVYNNYWLSTNGGVSFPYPRVLNDNSTGRFINPADYDDHQNILYSARTTTTVNRLSNIGNGTPSNGFITISGMNSMASHLRVSPYDTLNSTLFVGTEAGDLYKVTNANGSPTTTSIGAALPSGRISCVEIGASEQELLVTLSNYGLTSVWYSSNGGSSWSSKEGNLPDMPIRWALFNPNDRNEVILATEVGVWGTTNFNSSSPNWTASNSGLSNVRVDMLQIRESDQEVIAVTFGRGLFSSGGFRPQPLVANFSSNLNQACPGDTIQLSDASTGNITSWQWQFTPGTVTFVNGSSASSPNPAVVLNAAGTYDLSLTITDNNSSDSISKAAFLQQDSLPQISFNIPMALNPFCKDDTVTLRANPPGGSWFGPAVTDSSFYTSQAGDGTHTIYYQLNYGNGCSVVDSIDLLVEIIPKPTISRNGTQLSCDQNGFNYQWIHNGMPLGNTQSITIGGNGSYVVRIGKGSLCHDDSEPEQVNDFSTEDLKEQLQFTLYPNPSQGQLRLSLLPPNGGRIDYQLIDSQGQIVAQKQLESQPLIDEVIDLSHLPAGAYQLQLRQGAKKLLSERIVLRP